MQQSEFVKPLPASLDAERALLGATLLDQSAALKVFALVRENDFSLSENRVVYRHALLVSAQGSAPDLSTVTESLRSAGDLERGGGAGYISGLIDGVPCVSNVEHYARIVRDKARMRALIAYAENLQRRAFDAGEFDADQLIERAVSEVLSIAGGDGGLVLVLCSTSSLYKWALPPLSVAAVSPLSARPQSLDRPRKPQRQFTRISGTAH